MLNLFNGQGALSPEELKEFVELYEKYGGHNWVTSVNSGNGIEAMTKTLALLNVLSQNMGKLTDRLVLTIVEINKRKLSQHSGDCTIYASSHNGTPEAGVCICGYGLQVMKETGNKNELYSRELKGTLVQQIGVI